MTERCRKKVVVIGGGIAGLSCALALAREGLAVTLLERCAGGGGRARSWLHQASGDRVDTGPHIVLSEYRNMLRLLDQLGTSNRLVWEKEKFITLVDGDRRSRIRMHSLPAPLHFAPDMFRLPQVSFCDLASNRHLLWRVMRMTPAEMDRLDCLNAEVFLRQLGVNRHFINWFWRSASMSIMNVPLEECSAGALMNFFRFMIGRSGYQVGFAGSALGDLFVPGCEEQIRELGGEILYDSRAVELLADGQIRGVKLEDGRQLEADYVVSALPPGELHELLPAAWTTDGQHFSGLRSIRPSPYVSTYLWFDRKLSKERFWARVWEPDSLNYDSYDLSNIRLGWEDRPSVIASNIIYSHRADALSDREIVRITLRELEGFLPDIAHARLLHSSVHRIGMAIPAPHPGSEVLRLPVRTPVKGFFLAGDWIRTGLPASMESAVRAALLSAEALLAECGQARKLAAPLPEAEGIVRYLGP